MSNLAYETQRAQRPQRGHGPKNAVRAVGAVAHGVCVAHGIVKRQGAKSPHRSSGSLGLRVYITGARLA
jgi:hypothetical protein